MPKFSDFTDFSSIISKMKNTLESITGPSVTSATEEALAKEEDPIKAKFLEVELLIGQLHDLNIMQNKTLSDLKGKYQEIKTIAYASELKDPKANTETANKTAAKSKEPEEVTPEQTETQSKAEKSDDNK